MNRPVTIKEVSKTIEKVKIGKDPIPDRISKTLLLLDSLLAMCTTMEERFI